MRVKNLLLLLLCSAMIFSCNSNKNDNYSGCFNFPIDSTPIKDIPLSNGEYSSYYRAKIEFEKKLGFSSLENGSNDIEIRIHYNVGLLYEGQTIIIKQTPQGWNGRLYHYKFKFPEKDSLIITAETEKNVEPKHSWHSLIQKLCDLNILTLPDGSKVPGYGECVDGYGITIEIAAKNYYRIYNYTCFDEEDFWQAKNVEQILETLEKEFRFKRIS